MTREDSPAVAVSWWAETMSGVLGYGGTTLCSSGNSQVDPPAMTLNHSRNH